MDRGGAKRILEGILFISGQPVPPKRLKEVIVELDQPAITELVAELNAEYQSAQHAFRIQEVAGGYQLVTDPELAASIKRALELPRQESVSKPALETLAIIAYRQPITKAEIETIRGVDGTATLETLLEHQFVRVVGRKETPGRPLLYGTTEEFLRHFGLKSVKDLPPMDQASRTVPSFEEPETQPIVPLAQVAEPAESGTVQAAESGIAQSAESEASSTPGQDSA